MCCTFASFSLLDNFLGPFKAADIFDHLGLASRPELKANRNAILTCPEAGDEAGMMKCMYHVVDRQEICYVLQSSDADQFKERMAHSPLQVQPSEFDSDMREA